LTQKSQKKNKHIFIFKHNHEPLGKMFPLFFSVKLFSLILFKSSYIKNLQFKFTIIFFNKLDRSPNNLTSKNR